MVLGQRLDSAWKHTLITVVAGLAGNFSTFFAPDESIYSKENLEEPVSRKTKKKGSPRQWLCGCGVANPDLDLSLPDSGRLRFQDLPKGGGNAAAGFQ